MTDPQYNPFQNPDRAIFPVEDTAIDEGPSSFGAVDPELSFGAPAPSIDDEQRQSAAGFAEAAVARDPAQVDPRNALRDFSVPSTPGVAPLPAVSVPGYSAPPVPPVPPAPVAPVPTYGTPPVAPVPAAPVPPVYAAPAAPAYEPPAYEPPAYEPPAAPAPVPLSHEYVVPPVPVDSVFTAGNPFTGIPSADAVATPALREPVKRKRGTKVLAGGVAALVLVAGSAYAATQLLGSGGVQPESVLPANTIAFSKVDFNPAASQKIAALSLVGKFPGLHSANTGNLQTSLLKPLLGQAPGVSYDSDVAPWLGDRVAVAVVPTPGVGDGYAAVIAAAYTDESKMRAGLTHIQQVASAPSVDDPLAGAPAPVGTAQFGYAVRNGYVLIAQDQAEANAVAAAKTTLADNTTFTGDEKALSGDQVAVAWVDLHGVATLVQKATQAGADTILPEGMDLTRLTGRVVVGVHAGTDYVQVQGLAREIPQQTTTGALGQQPTRLAGQLPADSLVAFSASGVGDFAASLWQAYKDNDTFGIAADASQLGLVLPDDLRTVLGSDLAVTVSGDFSNPTVGARVTTKDPTRATSLLSGLLDGQAVVNRTGDGYTIATTPEAAKSLASDGGLGATSSFKRAVPDASGAGAIAYVNVGKILDQAAKQPDLDAQSRKQMQEWAAVDAVGLSAHGGPNAGFLLRITTR